MGRFKPLFVLDASCGSGQLVYVLRYLGVNAFGIDQGRIYLSRTANNIKDFLVEADIDLSVLPFANEYFDLIVSHHSIEHLTNPDNFILEAKRVLKPRGIVFFRDNWPPFEAPRLIYILRLLKILQNLHSVHPNAHSGSFWQRKFEAYGFNQIGNLNSFVRRTCIDLDPPHWWFLEEHFIVY